MKPRYAITALAIVCGNSAVADSRVAALCGEDHMNEIAAIDDVVENPDGYYIRSLKTQISHGDPRIIQSNSPVFHLCTLPAAIPEMDSAKAFSLMTKRRVKILFAPVNCPKHLPNS